MYSQNNEEEILAGILPDKGRFLDVGAYTGKEFSNTLALFERGWTGVLVEPSPTAFAALQKNYEGKDGALLVNAAIGPEDGLVDLWDSGGDAISSTSIAHKEKWERGYKCKFKKIRMWSITFKTLFEEHGSDYDFVNIDTEGTNLAILKLFPFDKCLPKCICIEHDSQVEEMQVIMAKHGYKFHASNGENLIVVRP